MKSAELKVIKFDGNDVIATSGLKMSGVQDGTSGNIKFGAATNSEEFGDMYLEDSFYLSASQHFFGGYIASNEENVTDILNGTYVYYTGDDILPEVLGGNGTTTCSEAGYTSFYLHQ